MKNKEKTETAIIKGSHLKGIDQLSNRARQIAELHADLMISSLEKSIRIGELLTAQKKECGHGNFGKWIRETFGDFLSERTVRHYMKAYEHREVIEGNKIASLKELHAHLRGSLPAASKQPTKRRPAKITFTEADKNRRDRLMERCGLSLEQAEAVIRDDAEMKAEAAADRKRKKALLDEEKARLAKRGKLAVKKTITLNNREANKIERLAAEQGKTFADLAYEKLLSLIS